MGGEELGDDRMKVLLIKAPALSYINGVQSSSYRYVMPFIHALYFAMNNNENVGILRSVSTLCTGSCRNVHPFDVRHCYTDTMYFLCVSTSYRVEWEQPYRRVHTSARRA